MYEPPKRSIQMPIVDPEMIKSKEVIIETYIDSNGKNKKKNVYKTS